MSRVLACQSRKEHGRAFVSNPVIQRLTEGNRLALGQPRGRGGGGPGSSALMPSAGHHFHGPEPRSPWRLSPTLVGGTLRQACKNPTSPVNTESLRQEGLPFSL